MKNKKIGNPKGRNQYTLRSNRELQRIINKYPYWTKKDFIGEGKLNPIKKNRILTRTEADRPDLKFHKVGRRLTNKNIAKYLNKINFNELKKDRLNFKNKNRK